MGRDMDCLKWAVECGVITERDYFKAAARLYASKL